VEDKAATADVLIASVAGRQHGVVTLRQLEEAGLGRAAVSKRVKSGRLHRVHRGVYAVGHTAPSLHRCFMAAVLACGENAVLSHGSAAVLWKLLKPLDGLVHVSVPSIGGRERRQGIKVHRCISLAGLSTGGEQTRQVTLVTRRDGIPVTTVSRAIDDIRGLLPPHLVRRAIRQAEFMGLRLDGVESDHTRSDLEAAFLELWRRHRIPPPEVNVKLGRWEVDFLWRAQRLVVEADTWIYHRGSVAFEDDHTRDLDLRAAGYTVLRFTDRQLEEEPGRIVADVARALEQEVLTR
jgi:very-short-patch-repair endonuclease